jgi:hypothetical protein
MGAAAVVAPRGNPGLRLLLMAVATYDWADEQYVPPSPPPPPPPHDCNCTTPRHCFWAQVTFLGGAESRTQAIILCDIILCH